ncbi:MAG: RagB/SusD family nutrient uptake outer membrane protein, partial [Proteobacteria bacterium]
MKKFKFSLLSLAIAFVALQSCTDDLNVEPKDDDIFLSEDFFASSPNSYKQAIAGIYGNLTLTGANGPG